MLFRILVLVMRSCDSEFGVQRSHRSTLFDLIFFQFERPVLLLTVRITFLIETAKTRMRLVSLRSRILLTTASTKNVKDILASSSRCHQDHLRKLVGQHIAAFTVGGL